MPTNSKYSYFTWCVLASHTYKFNFRFKFLTWRITTACIKCFTYSRSDHAPNSRIYINNKQHSVLSRPSRSMEMVKNKMSKSHRTHTERAVKRASTASAIPTAHKQKGNTIHRCVHVLNMIYATECLWSMQSHWICIITLAQTSGIFFVFFFSYHFHGGTEVYAICILLHTVFVMD